MKCLKALIPDFRSTETEKTKSYLHIILCAVMIIAVFLPWIRYSTIETGKVNELVSANILGITTWYGIVALATALAAGFGILRSQYALTFWACVLGSIFGYIGMNTFADVKFDDYIIFKESFEEAERMGNATNVNHLGAKIFTIASCLLAGFSLVKVFCKNEGKEESLISKVTLALAAFIGIVLTLDAIIIKPTCISLIAANIFSWGLTEAIVIVLILSYVSNTKAGKSNKLNNYAVAILTVAFLFTNANATHYKAQFCEASTYSNIRSFDDSDNTCYDDRDDEREVEKKTKDALEKDLKPIRPGQSISKKNSDSDYDDYDYYDGYR